MGFGIWGLGFGGWGSRFRVHDQGSGFRIRVYSFVAPFAFDPNGSTDWRCVGGEGEHCSPHVVSLELTEI